MDWLVSDNDGEKKFREYKDAVEYMEKKSKDGREGDYIANIRPLK